jgi:uncharacterized protein (UPF0548 family)
MDNESLLGPPKVRRRLAKLRDKDVNFSLDALADASPANGWELTDLRQALPGEPPGPPLENGSWALARQLMRGYEFADPSIVRAYYDPALPLEQRDMLLRLQAFGRVRLFVGVRVGEVYERTQIVDGRRARVWGWNYRTLKGHLEMGQMDWEVWKWTDSGEVEFRVHAVSRTAPIANPVVWLGYRLFRGRERRAFLQSTLSRTRAAVDLATPYSRISGTASTAG